MRKFVVEMCVGFGANVTVEADNYEDAVSKAKEEVINNPSEYMNEVEVEGINFIQAIL